MKLKFRIAIMVSAIMLFAIVILFYQIVDMPEPTTAEVPECEALIPKHMPIDVGKGFMERELDFSDKVYLGDGKYGFYKKLVVDKQSIIQWYIWEDSQLKNYSYGIYSDRELRNPIKKIRLADVVEWFNQKEIGEVSEKYKNFSDILLEVLNPGTYYMAVYTTAPMESLPVRFELWQSIVDTELTLDEGEWGYFISAGSSQKTYFEINVPRSGVLNLTCRWEKFIYDLWLCDKDKNIIEKASLEPKKYTKGNTQKAVVHVPEAGKYYLRVVTPYEEPTISGFKIRYRMK